MTNETKERIKYYMNALPHMKEKVIGAAMMMIIAMSVMVTATYAWITLSTAPEVTSIDTSVTANGSLEIALANGTGSAPGKSAVGDSTGAGTKISLANTTWGNLVNLSDPSYGLSKITLRPAALNGESGLLTNPLYGVSYGEDGRVSTMVTDDDFAYVYYDPTVNSNQGAFLADLSGSHLGVRAISTVKYENVTGQETQMALLQGINQSLTTAKNNYASMTNEKVNPGKSYITSLEGLIQIYAQNIIDKRFSGAAGVETLDVTEYVPALYDMMVYFYENVAMHVGESYLNMANLLDLLHKDGSTKGNIGYDTVDAFITAAYENKLPAFVKSNIVSLYDYTDSATNKKITGFANDYVKLKEYLLTDDAGVFDNLTASQKNSSLAYWAHVARNGGTVYWKDIQTHINWICNINTATLDSYKISSLSSMSIALEVIRKPNPHDAVINDGAIFRMEKRTGQKMSPTIAVTVDASAVTSLLKDPIKMTAKLTTSASDTPSMITDREQVKSFYSGSFRGSDATAEDTYAMAIDLWVRTNAGSNGETTTSDPVKESVTDEQTNITTTTETTVTTSAEQAYLTLEGALLMEKQQHATTITDLNGDEQPAYTASYTVDGTVSQKEVFMRYGEYYYITTENDVKVEKAFADDLAAYGNNVTDVSYTPKMTEQNVIVGYEGANRVWNEEQMAGFDELGTSATQGGGSCYVFYADTPADQSRFLELLGSMRVVFVDANGGKIGSASLDTTNYYAETGKVTVPLVLDKSEAINLGTDVDGNITYGLMPLVKNAATRVTALIYLDGTRLTNEMVLASGDIQGTLNIQFGSSVALTRTTVTTETVVDGENTTTTTTTTTDYVTGKDSEAIKDDKVMNQFVEASAKFTPAGPVEYDPNKAASTTLEITVDGIEPQSVSAKFIRKISSTQGVLQDAITLSGNGANWSKTCTFDRPGTYVLRSVWLDGVEYDLIAPVEYTVTGSSVTSLTCEAVTDKNNNYGMIMTANNSFSTKMTLGFSSSKVVPNKVNGIFMDEESGRQVNVPFYLEEGTWQGIAKFTTSGTFTMKYVEIDGDIYELNERLQPTLEILLGLKVRTWISADAETLGKLQSVMGDDGTALATYFVLDISRTGIVSLNVAAEIYDNTGNEITGLSNVELYYGRVGSSTSTSGLDSNLTWNASAGRYTGNFMVSKAGTYRFKEVKIGTSNTIESYTDAPNIQAMPPEDAYYFNNYTQDYQYAPNKDGALTIGIAYSNAVTKIKGTIKNKDTGAIIPNVEGKMGAEAEDQGDKSVNLWRFVVPATNDSQEGDWELTDITMYGVYYDGKYYSDSEDSEGATIDLADKNIETRIANYLYVELNTGAERVFNCDFMSESNIENNMTVTIADFKGNAVDAVEISDVKVKYYLDYAKVTLNNYYYQSSSLGAQTVTGTGTLVDNSSTVYTISPMNFKYVGPYNTCAVSFNLKEKGIELSNAVPVTAGVKDSGTKLSYKVTGALVESVPVYEVKWKQLDVSITGISPAYKDSLQITSETDSNISNILYDKDKMPMQSSVTNWMSNYQNTTANAYAAVVYMNYHATLRYFDLPSVTLQLNNAGNNFDNVLLEVSRGSATNTTSKYTFTSNGQSVTETIGYTNKSGVTVTHSEAGKQVISTVNVTDNNETAWTAILEHDLIINQQNKAPELSFTGLADYPKAKTPGVLKTTSNGVKLSTDGSNSMQVTLPVVEWSQKETVSADIEPSNQASSASKVCYYTSSWGTFTYYLYNRTTTTWTETSLVTSYTDYYHVSGWKINGKIYAPGETVTISGNTVATAVVEKLESVFVSTDTSTRTGTTILDVSNGTSKSYGVSAKIPSGYTKVEESDIHTTAYTEYTEWK